MDKLIGAMSNINVRKNDGYFFIKRDEIYVPIIRTILSITKRSFYSLPLLDEIVLRLRLLLALFPPGWFPPCGRAP